MTNQLQGMKIPCTRVKKYKYYMQEQWMWISTVVHINYIHGALYTRMQIHCIRFEIFQESNSYNSDMSNYYKCQCKVKLASQEG